MSNPVGESLSEPDPEPSPYQDALFNAHDELKIYPPYPKYVNQTREFEVHLYDDYERIEVEASLYGSLVDRYMQLDSDERFALERHIKSAMGQTAALLVQDELIDSHSEKGSIALINNLPVIFEPMNHAMLVGKWDDEWEKRKMNIRSQFIETREQQRMLLGGLAAMVTYLEQR